MAKQPNSRPAERSTTDGAPKGMDSEPDRTASTVPGPLTVSPRTRTNGTTGRGKVGPRGEATVRTAEGASTEISGQFARFQTDAPACDHCGAITVRNGNCYLCYNCGNSMGCS
jgi:hypothetical protein